MKDIVKIALGVVLGVAICAAIALPIKGYYTASRYEKCVIGCVEKYSGRFLPLTTVDKYGELMIGAEDMICPEECGRFWTVLDEFHWLMGITYR